jgi:hypothetical protein
MAVDQPRGDDLPARIDHDLGLVVATLANTNDPLPGQPHVSGAVDALRWIDDAAATDLNASHAR